MTEPISVTALNQYVKQLMDHDRLLNQVMVRGEISNYKLYPSGHHYFSLKDGESSVRCVLFRREAAGLRFRPENGMQIIAAGRVSVFPRDGAYQLYCSRLSPDGVGELALAFEQLKNRLYREGLFDPAHKKPLPDYPQTIALVTSPVGAAVRDMIRILGARYPLAKVLVVPARVQGEEAPSELVQAIDLVNACDLADLILVGRGGGSMEDLWAFNDEGVARAIYRSHIPVISAVGHEPDVTIADFVADVRASTPSNGAELAVPDQGELRDTLLSWEARMEGVLSHRLAVSRGVLERMQKNPYLQSPLSSIRARGEKLDHQGQRLLRAAERTLEAHQRKVAGIAASLDALSPYKVLGRGYSITQTQGGQVVSSVEQVEEGEPLRIRVSDGTILCAARGKEHANGGKKTDL
jgi:exodeoxyribonuclease VII large subunit